MKVTSVVLSLALLASSCAHQTPGKKCYAVAGEAPQSLELHAYIDKEMSSPRFAMLRLNVWNRGEDWVRIKEAELVPIDGVQKEKMHIILNQDLEGWVESTRETLAIDNSNFQDIAGAVLMASSVLLAVAAADGNSGQATTAGVLAGGAVATSTIKNVQHKQRAVERGNTLPQGHLLLPFSVPPESRNRRWLLIQKPSTYELTALQLQISYLDGRKATYQLEL